MKKSFLVLVVIFIVFFLLLYLTFDFLGISKFDLIKTKKSIFGPSCITEGQEGNYFRKETCCSGLNTGGGDNSGYHCLSATNGSFVCVNCGDGICGKGEGVCNCPLDCE